MAAAGTEKAKALCMNVVLASNSPVLVICGAGVSCGPGGAKQHEEAQRDPRRKILEVLE